MDHYQSLNSQVAEANKDISFDIQLAIFETTYLFGAHFQRKSIHPYYLSLDPNAEDLAHATGLFLSYNSWTQAIVIRDSSTFYMSFTAALYHHYVRGNKLQIILSERLSDGELFEMVSEVIHSKVRVIVVACGQLLAERIFRQARKAGLLNGRWIWILVESAFSSNGLPGSGELHFPPGVLGLKLRKHSLDRAAVRSAVLFFSDAMTHCSNLSSWTLDKDLLNYTSPISCWFGPDERRGAFANFVYRSQEERKCAFQPQVPIFRLFNVQSYKKACVLDETCPVGQKPYP